MSTRQQGFTLTELSIASCMILIVMVGATSFFRDAMRSMSGSAEEARRRNGLAAAFERMQADVELCAVERALVTETNAGDDALTVQVPVVMTTRGPSYGAETKTPMLHDGFLTQKHPDWSVRFRVRGENLVREVVDSAGQVQEGPEVIFAGIATAERSANGVHKGFAVTWLDPVAAPGVLQVRIVTRATESRPQGEEAVTTFHLVEMR